MSSYGSVGNKTDVCRVENVPCQAYHGAGETRGPDRTAFKRHSTYRLGTHEFQDDKLSVLKPTKPCKTQGFCSLGMLRSGQPPPRLPPNMLYLLQSPAPWCATLQASGVTRAFLTHNGLAPRAWKGSLQRQPFYIDLQCRFEMGGTQTTWEQGQIPSPAPDFWCSAGILPQTSALQNTWILCPKTDNRIPSAQWIEDVASPKRNGSHQSTAVKAH